MLQSQPQIFNIHTLDDCPKIITPGEAVNYIDDEIEESVDPTTKMLKKIVLKCSGIQRGDIVYINSYHWRLNEGLWIFDGKKLQELDHHSEDYYQGMTSDADFERHTRPMIPKKFLAIEDLSVNYYFNIKEINNQINVDVHRYIDQLKKNLKGHKSHFVGSDGQTYNVKVIEYDDEPLWHCGTFTCNGDFTLCYFENEEYDDDI